MNNGETKYNLTLIPLRKTRGGNSTWILDEEAVARFRDLEPGGQILVKENRNKKPVVPGKNPSPDFYMEYISKADVEAFRAQREAGGETAVQSGSESL